MRSKKMIPILIAACMIMTIGVTGCSNKNSGSKEDTTPPTDDKVAADAVYKNGNIYTVDDKNPTASALAVKGDKLIFVGNDDDVEKYIGTSTNVVDLEKQTVLPGLIEGHMHYALEGEKLLMLDGFEKSKEDILAEIKAEADRLPDGEWIIGRGWNQELWEDNSFPTKEDLDVVAPNNPVMLTRTCNHMIWVNSKALEICNVTKDTPNPDGGEILKDENGEIAGVLVETARTLISEHVPPYSIDRKKEALLQAQEELFSYGITSAASAGISDMQEIANLKDLYSDGSLKIRTYNMMKADAAEEVYKIGAEIGLYDNRYTCRTIKAVNDGSLGARSAWMLEEYSDEPGHTGNGRYTDEEIYDIIKNANDNGFQVAGHAIGDATTEQILKAYEKVLNENPTENHRHRIEHYQIVTDNQIAKAKELGVIPSMHAVHATSDKNMAEIRIGSERIKGAYAWRNVIDAGLIIVNGSDAPVEKVNPYEGLYASVTRMDKSGEPEGGWYPEQCMTREEALKSFTLWAAYGQFEEEIKGSLEAGKLADFIIIDRDYMECDPMEIKDIKVIKTYVGGEEVYSSK